MKRPIAAFLVLIGLCGPTFADSRPISVHTIVKTDESKGVINRYEEETTTYKAEVRNIITGIASVEVRTVAVPVAVTVKSTREWTLANHDVLDHQGTAIQKEQIWQRIKPGVVVFHCEAMAVTPAFLKTLSANAMIVVPKSRK